MSDALGHTRAGHAIDLGRARAGKGVTSVYSPWEKLTDKIIPYLIFELLRLEDQFKVSLDPGRRGGLSKAG